MTQLNHEQYAFQFELPITTAEVLPLSTVPASNQPKFKEETQEFLSIFHETSLVKAVHEAIAECHKTADSKAVESMLLIGVSGVGKSEMCCRYSDKYPMHIVDGQIIAPVLYLLLPDSANTKDVVVGLLEQLNQKLNIQGSEKVLKRRLIAQLKNAQTKLVILDEAQRLNHHKYQHSPDCVANLLAYIQDTAQVSFVLAGTNDLLELLMHIEKASVMSESTPEAKQEPTIRRFRKNQSIPVYKVRAKNWLGLLKRTFEHLPRVVDSSNCTFINDRIFIATQGRLGFFSKLFKELLETTFAEDELTLKEFSVAYKKTTSLSLCGFNPFEADETAINQYLKNVLKIKGVK